MNTYIYVYVDIYVRHKHFPQFIVASIHFDFYYSLTTAR